MIKPMDFKRQIWTIWFPSDGYNRIAHGEKGKRTFAIPKREFEEVKMHW